MSAKTPTSIIPCSVKGCSKPRKPRWNKCEDCYRKAYSGLVAR